MYNTSFSLYRDSKDTKNLQWNYDPLQSSHLLQDVKTMMQWLLTVSTISMFRLYLPYRVKHTFEKVTKE
jgi:hypothetical protein